MEYTIAPGEKYERHVQQPGQSCHWAENSMLNPQSTDGYSLYLCYERGPSFSKTKKLQGT